MDKTVKNVSVDELKNDPILIMELMTAIFTGIPVEAALPLLCTTADTVCEAAGMTTEETLEMWDELHKLATECNKALGNRNDKKSE